MNRHATWIGAALVGGLLLGAAPANADVRWPWESPDKKEKKERNPVPPKTSATRVPGPGAKATPAFNGTAQDQEMLPRLTGYYQKQLDLADRSVQSGDAEVRSFALKLQRESERALGILNEEARSKGLALRPHVRASVNDRLQQAGRTGGLRGVPNAPAAPPDIEFLTAVMANIKEIRPDFADYKAQHSDRAVAQELRRLFDDELVPDYDEAKALHDRIRNQARTK